MQNQYTCDIGDFGKYGLLRALTRDGLGLGVNWYLAPDEAHKPDGRKISYLDRSARNLRQLAICDPALYDALERLVREGKRQVAAIAAAGILPRGTAFFDEIIPADDSRRAWHARALKATAGRDIVFLDPDNGIASGAGATGSRKHAGLDEIADYARRGQIVIVYHHLCRQGAGREQMRQHRARLARLPGVGEVRAYWYHRGTARFYFVVAPVTAKQLPEFPDERWQAHFSG